MNAKQFSQRFNQEIRSLGLPDDLTDKTKAIAKVFGITRHMANSILFGHTMPELEDIDRIACTLEVCPMWLCGRGERRKSYSPMSIETTE